MTDFKIYFPQFEVTVGFTVDVASAELSVIEKEQNVAVKVLRCVT